MRLDRRKAGTVVRQRGLLLVIKYVALPVIVSLLLPLNATGQGRVASEEKAEKASSSKGLEEEIRALKDLLQQLAEERRAEIEELRRRIAELEEKLRETERAREEEELEKLLAEAEAATAEEAEREEKAKAQREVFVGRQRNLQALNPEISFLGDVSYDWTDTAIRDQFLIRGVELNFQAPLDPYTRFKGVLCAHQEAAELGHEDDDVEDVHEHGDHINVGVEEAYMEWVALPLNSRLRVGKFRQQFGTLNRWHPHALPSVDVPFALRNAFGHDGLVGLGIGVDWQLPGLWARSNGLTLEVVNADNSAAFAGAHFRDPTLLLRHTGFFDFGPDTYLELGLNGITGPNNEESTLDTTVSSLDFNFVWEPVERAKYRNLEVRGEYMHSRYETADQGTIESNSLYTYLSWRLTRRWIIGLRYDDAELPRPIELLHEQEFGGGLRERAWSPFLTFWQSEFVRMRLQYQHATRDFAWGHGGDDDDRMWLQVTFAAGPHKHEAY